MPPLARPARRQTLRLLDSPCFSYDVCKTMTSGPEELTLLRCGNNHGCRVRPNGQDIHDRDFRSVEVAATFASLSQEDHALHKYCSSPFSPTSTMEPELEVHSVEAEEPESSIIVDLQCAAKTKHAEAEPEVKHGHQHPPPNTGDEREEASVLYLGLDLDSSFCWSDDDYSAAADIRDSIVAIREEASRVDARVGAIMASDKLDTLKQEFSSVSRKLHIRSVEVRELKAMVGQTAMNVGHLELERDLYKADAEKFKTDLYHLTDKIRALDLQEDFNPSHLKESPSNVSHSGECRSQASLFSEEGANQNKRQVLREESAPYGVLYSESASYSVSEIRPVSRISESIDGSLTQSSRGISKKSSGCSRGKRFLKRVRRRTRKTPPSTETVSSSLDPFTGVSPDLQQQDVHQSLKSSMETSEELRRRLAMICHHYENLVRQLQNSLVDERSGRIRMQVDLGHRMAQMSRQAAHGSLQGSVREVLEDGKTWPSKSA
jgi:hypothetical protein